MKAIYFSLLFVLFCIPAFYAQDNYDMKTGRSYFQSLDYGEAVPYLQRAAKDSYAEAQYYLGILYQKGLGVPKDNVISMNMFQKAADGKYASAQFLVGQMYVTGNGVQKNLEKGILLIKQAAIAQKDAYNYLENLAKVEPTAKNALNDLTKRNDLRKQFDPEIHIANVADARDLQENETRVDIAYLLEHRVVVAEPEKEKIFKVSDLTEVPSFPGGDAALMKWLGDNIEYPAIAEVNGIEGVVHLSFVVDKDGTVKDVTVRKSLDPSCDREAKTKVSRMPNWIPGRKDEHPVAVSYY